MVGIDPYLVTEGLRITFVDYDRKTEQGPAYDIGNLRIKSEIAPRWFCRSIALDG